MPFVNVKWDEIYESFHMWASFPLDYYNFDEHHALDLLFHVENSNKNSRFKIDFHHNF